MRTTPSRRRGREDPVREIDKAQCQEGPESKGQERRGASVSVCVCVLAMGCSRKKSLASEEFGMQMGEASGQFLRRQSQALEVETDHQCSGSLMTRTSAK